MPAKEIVIAKTFDNGIYFSCKLCGRCCKGFDEGEVYLYLDDIKLLANHLNLELSAFSKKYLKICQDAFYWREKGNKRGRNYKYDTLSFKFSGKDHHCVFLGEDNTCTVWEYSPFQCKSFPFWQMMVSSPKKLKEYSKKCPGLKDSNGENSKFHSKVEMLEWARKEQEIEKNYFFQMKENSFDIFRVYPFLPKDISRVGED